MLFIPCVDPQIVFEDCFPFHNPLTSNVPFVQVELPALIFVATPTPRPS
jgi:hypothetical protein